MLIPSQPRVALATLSVLVALAGILVAVRGLWFDVDAGVRYGAAAVIAGAASFVLLLDAAPNLDDDHR